LTAEAKPGGFGLFETLMIATPGYVVVFYSLLFLHLYKPEMLPAMLPSWLSAVLVLVAGIMVGYALYIMDIARIIDNHLFHFMTEIETNTANTLSQPCRQCNLFRQEKCKSLIWDRDALWDIFFYYVDSKLPSMWRDLAFWMGPTYFLVIYMLFFSMIFFVLSLLSLIWIHWNELLRISMSNLGYVTHTLAVASPIEIARLTYALVALGLTIIMGRQLKRGRVRFLGEINRRQLRFMTLDKKFKSVLCGVASNPLRTRKEDLENRDLRIEHDVEIKQTIDAYSWLAEKAPEKLPEPIPELGKTCEAIHLTKKSLVLDAACGYGKNSAYFYRQGIPIVGVDNCGNQLRRAVQYARNEGRDFDVARADVRYPPFRNFVFDLILLNSIIFHLPSSLSRESVLISSWKIIKPSGHLLIDIENLYYIPHFLKAIWMSLYVRHKKWLFTKFGDSYIINRNRLTSTIFRRYARFQTSTELKRLLDEANFQPILTYHFSGQVVVKLFKKVRARRISSLCRKS